LHENEQVVYVLYQSFGFKDFIVEKNNTKGLTVGIHFFSFFHPTGKVGGIQIGRCQWIAVKCCCGPFGALAMNPSGFCNGGDVGAA
jgi:hypothetical protein